MQDAERGELTIMAEVRAYRARIAQLEHALREAEPWIAKQCGVVVSMNVMNVGNVHDLVREALAGSSPPKEETRKTSYLIKVPNNDEGKDLGEYQADYLPRVNDPFVLWHRMLSPDKEHPFCGIVQSVTHEAFDKDHPYARGGNTPGVVTTTVWLAEEMAAPTLYCDCTSQEREQHVVKDGRCDNCGHVREK